MTSNATGTIITNTKISSQYIRDVTIKGDKDGSFDIVRFTLENELNDPKAEGKLVVHELVDQTFRAYLTKQDVSDLIAALEMLHFQMK